MQPFSRETIDWAEKNLDRHLEWIGRHDTRSSFVTGVTIGMIGFLFSIIPEKTPSVGFYVSFSIHMVLSICSLGAIYFGHYPRTVSSNSSLLFFGTISNLKFDEYAKRFKAQSDEDYLDDLLSQCHTNAIILSSKFRALKLALVCLLLSVLPWGFAIYISKTTS